MSNLWNFLKMTNLIKFLAKISLVIGSLLVSLVYGQSLNVGAFGGANAAAQNKAWYQTWSKQTGVQIIQKDFTDDLSTLARDNFDLVEVSGTQLTLGCDLGKFERISLSDFELSSRMLIPSALNACGVGFMVYSNVLAFNRNLVSENPTSWQDFWDVKKFPGKRGLRKTALFTLEFALLADGVAHENIYSVLSTEEGKDRAFAKLDQIKPYVIWWEKASDALTSLQKGEVVMSSLYNGRISGEHKKNGIDFIWQDGIYDVDFWAIPKNAVHKDLAKDFIKFTLQPEKQANFAHEINYGVTNRRANSLVSKDVKDKLPTFEANFRTQLSPNNYFWTDYGNKLEQRFNEWLKL